ncbi:MAG: site-specific integrase [Planctomycetes bacterium]|nr:site-specific integrase [Planctomycetota bacterium]
MATLQLIKNAFHIRFRFGSRPFRRSLGTVGRDEAENTRMQVEVNLHRIKVGVIPPPPHEADVPLYVMTGGKEGGKPTVAERPLQPVPSLKERWDDYLASLPTGAKEESSLMTEKGHFNQLSRILKGTTRVADLATDDLQRYIGRRAKEPGFRGLIKSRTIRKEISTLRNVWNNFALPRKVVDQNFRAAFGKLMYPTEHERPAFQTWEQIERQVERGGLSKIEIANLWDCLFLDIGRIREFLAHVRQKLGKPGWVYPALVAAAHTGCRRGEIMRSFVNDWDIETDSQTPMVQWREKKKDRNKQFTFRQVSVTPFLRGVMAEWLAPAKHPGGQNAFCGSDGKPLTKKEALYWFKSVIVGSKWSVLRGWHVFRHSFVSCMATKGVDQRIIDGSVGHQTDDMRKRYRHLFPQKQHEVLAAVFSDGE